MIDILYWIVLVIFAIPGFIPGQITAKLFGERYMEGYFVHIFVWSVIFYVSLAGWIIFRMFF